MRRIWLAVPLMAVASVAQAGTEFNVGSNTCAPNCQPQFDSVVDDIGAALNYKMLAPAEATGITGISAGAFVNYTPVENKQAWKDLTGTNVDTVGMAGISVGKGLPMGIDLGAFYTTVPGTGVSGYGAEVRYALLKGGIAEPALAVRGAYMATSGIDDFDYNAWSADVTVSKGFALLTPYIGTGYVWATASPKGTTAQTAGITKDAKSNQSHVFAGVRISLGLIEMTPEYEHVGHNNAYNLRLGFSF